MIYVTTNEYLNLIKVAMDASDYNMVGERMWHPEDLHCVFETIALTVKVVLENAPVERR